jgi:ribonuclease HI
MRQEAADLLACGFKQDTLVALDKSLRKTELCVSEIDMRGLFVVVEDCYLIYRSMTAGEVYDFFNDRLIDLNQEWTAFCDGSGHGTKEALHPAGIGCVIYRPDEKPQLFAENIGLGTNNRAELCAVWRALRAVPDVMQPLLIRTDSEYAIGALTKDWARNANAELITNIRADLGYRKHVRFEHVDGHSGVEGNETADKLATIGRKIVTTVSLYEG